MKDIYVDICLKHGWTVIQEPESIRIKREMSNGVPVSFIIDQDCSFVEGIQRLYAGFDVNNAVVSWIQAVSCDEPTPDVQKMLDDAKAMKELLKPLSEALIEAYENEKADLYAKVNGHIFEAYEIDDIHDRIIIFADDLAQATKEAKEFFNAGSYVEVKQLFSADGLKNNIFAVDI